MELMEASVYVGDGALEVRDVPVPEPGPGEVLIEIAECGICGTDLHLVLERIARPGTVLGHEWSGTIAAIGPDVEGWSVGARVVCGPEPGCGECRACVRGRPSVCLRRPPVDHLSFRGAFARYVVAPADQLLAVPDDLPSRAAALTEPTAVAMHAVTLSGVDARRPGARDGRRTGRVAGDRGAARPGHRRRHRLRAGARPPRARVAGRRGPCGHAGRAADPEHGVARARALHRGVRVLGERGRRASRPSSSSTSPASACSWGPVTTSPASTTIG